MAEQQNEDATPLVSIPQLSLDEQALSVQISDQSLRTPSLSYAHSYSSSRSFRFSTVYLPNLLELKQTYTSDIDEQFESKHNDHNNTNNEEEFIQYANEETKDNESLSEYGFGVAFSYYKDWPYYPYVTPKYKNLKQELLNNLIQTVSIEKYNEIYKKGAESQQRCKIVAENDLLWNQLFNIKKESKISVQHILSIIFYTDITPLCKSMKYACRKMKPTESINEVKTRHRNFVNWLKLLFEAITLFGKKYTTKSPAIYHGLDIKFNFADIKASFHIPTSTTTEISIARTFAGDNGTIVEFGGFESIGCTRYFDTSSLSAFAHEKEYLFFFAELHIQRIIIGEHQCSLAPLSLYESIVTGCNIVEKVQLMNSNNSLNRKQQKKVQKHQFQEAQMKLFQYLNNEDNVENDTENETTNPAEKYVINIFQNYRAKCKNVYLNPGVIINNIGHTKLRQKFIEQNDKKEFIGYAADLLKRDENIDELESDLSVGSTKSSAEKPRLQKRMGSGIKIHDGYHFKWMIDKEEMDEWKSEWKDEELPSETFECDDGNTIFYAQMNYVDKIQWKGENGYEILECDPFGRITLYLYELEDGKTKLDNVSFDIYCKKLNKYYSRLENIDFDISEEGVENNKHYQGQSFDIELLDKVFKKHNDIIEWEFTIRYVL